MSRGRDKLRIRFRFSVFFEGLLEGGKVILENLPDQYQVYTKVFMHNSMSQADNLGPFNLTVLILEFFGQSVCRFTDNFKVSYYGIGCFLGCSGDIMVNSLA